MASYEDWLYFIPVIHTYTERLIEGESAKNTGRSDLLSWVLARGASPASFVVSGIPRVETLPSD